MNITEILSLIPLYILTSYMANIGLTNWFLYMIQAKRHIKQDWATAWWFSPFTIWASFMACVVITPIWILMQLGFLWDNYSDKIFNVMEKITNTLFFIEE